MNYFVVMIDYGRSGRESIVDPEITRREVLSRLRSGEYDRDRIAFIHFIQSGELPVDCTEELLSEALEGLSIEAPEIDRQAARFDHQRDLMKHSI